MVLELVYSDDERQLAQSTSMQIWNILYKETVADEMQIEGNEVDQDNPEEGGGDDKSSESSGDSEETEDNENANDTPPGGLISKAVERGTQVEVG